MRLGGEADHLVEHLAEAARAQRAQGDPELERIEAARRLEGLVHLVGLAAAGGVEVVGVPGGGREVDGHADEDGARRDGLEEALVEVDGHGAGALDAVEQVAAGGGDEQAAAVGGIDVQPHVGVLADVGDRRERVDAAAVGGAGGRDDAHRHLAGVDRVAQGVREGVGEHAAVGVGGDGEDGVVAEPEEPGGLLDAEVARCGRDDDELVQRRPAERVAPGGVLAGEEERLEVGLRAAGREDAVAGGETDPGVDPVDEAALHEGADPGLVVGVEGRVDGGDHRLGGDGGQRDGTVEVRRVVGVVEPDGVLGEEGVGLLDGERGTAPGSVEVDGVDELLELVSAGAGEGLGGGAQPVGDASDRVVHRGGVGVGCGGGQQLVHAIAPE